MEKLKIVGWTNFDDVFPTKVLNNENFQEVLNLIKIEIYEKEYIFSGEEHQYGLTGVPVFSDGTCFRASMRAWGSLMASCFTGPNGEEVSYMNFYMSLGEDAKMPEYNVINVEPAVLEEEGIGATLYEDKQILQEAFAMGMEFMTTDKVLKNIYNKIKENQ